MSNVLKTPKFTKDSKILSFDLEANGLHGEAFAIGAVVMDASGKIYDEFSGRVEIHGKVDEWVGQNVLPAIEDMAVSHSSYKHLREHFWSWFTKAKEGADYVLVNNGYPVEYRFLLQCQEDDIESRYWDHPFPILDLTSMLVAAGADVQEAKNSVMSDYSAQLDSSAHNPVYDSKVAVMTAFKVLEDN